MYLLYSLIKKLSLIDTDSHVRKYFDNKIFLLVYLYLKLFHILIQISFYIADFAVRALLIVDPKPLIFNFCVILVYCGELSHTTSSYLYASVMYVPITCDVSLFNVHKTCKVKTNISAKNVKCIKYIYKKNT